MERPRILPHQKHKEIATRSEGSLERVVRRIAKCEDCNGDAYYNEWPAGWMQTGASRWGEKYEKDGIAWHCPACRFNLRDPSNDGSSATGEL